MSCAGLLAAHPVPSRAHAAAGERATAPIVCRTARPHTPVTVRSPR
jgi:hypothetical protein